MLRACLHNGLREASGICSISRSGDLVSYFLACELAAIQAAKETGGKVEHAIENLHSM